MTEPHGTTAGRAVDTAAEGWHSGTDHHPEIDWVAAERSPEFQELVKKKNAFVVPATIFFLAWYTGFVLLCGYAPGFMGEEFLVDGLTIGYVLALSQFVMVWGLAAWYLRKSDREFDPLAERAIAAYVEDDMHPATPRFTRERVGATPVSEVER
jgi:uncharacterized membrane protein (DUF485 family)